MVCRNPGRQRVSWIQHGLIADDEACDISEKIRSCKATGDLTGLGRLMAEVVIATVRVRRHTLPLAVRRNHDPEDVMQMALALALEHLEKFRGETMAELIQWFRQVLWSTVDHLRVHETRRKRRPGMGEAIPLGLVAKSLAGIGQSRVDSYDPPTEAPGPAELCLMRESIEHMLAEIWALTPKCAPVVYLSCVCGLSTREIGALLRIPDHTAMLRLSRGRACLRRRIKSRRYCKG